MSALDDRRLWIQWLFENGKRGLDFLRKNKTVIKWEADGITKWKKSGGKFDFLGFDQPRKDIDKTKVHKRNIFIGGKAKKKAKAKTKRILEKNFTQDEIKSIKNLYIETSPKTAEKWAGLHECYTHPNGERWHVISIKPKFLGTDTYEDVLTHETVHALRRSQKRTIMDRNTNEKKTDLETVARISTPAVKNAGYYQFIPSEVIKKKVGKQKTAIEHDRKLLTGALNKRIKGKQAIKKVEKIYPKSLIRYAHFSPAENLDRYFFIKLKDGTTIRVHQQYPKGIKATLVEIRKDFRERYGRGIKVWEYRNGKKYKIL